MSIPRLHVYRLILCASLVLVVPSSASDWT